jgi:hypothetical protein
MGRSSTLDLVRQLTLIPPDDDGLDRYYDEALIELGDVSFVFEATLLPVSIAQASFTLPDFAVRLRQVFYDDRCLDAASVLDMQALSPAWRDAQGPAPCTYVTESETERTFRLFPVPMQPSKDFSFITGSPLGQDFPAYSVMTLHTSHPQDAPALMDLLIAHRILAREFARESQHQDSAYAQRCEVIYQLLLALLKTNHA